MLSTTNHIREFEKARLACLQVAMWNEQIAMRQQSQFGNVPGVWSHTEEAESGRVENSSGWLKRIASAKIKHLSGLIQQIIELLNGPESDEHGILRPTDAAFESARTLLVDAAIVLAPKQIPYGCASTDPQGGIRIEWVRPSISVHLVIPATDGRSPYVYHEIGDAYATVPATPEVLAFWLGKVS